jgi:hypothetical protein
MQRGGAGVGAVGEGVAGGEQIKLRGVGETDPSHAGGEAQRGRHSAGDRVYSGVPDVGDCPEILRARPLRQDHGDVEYADRE